MGWASIPWGRGFDSQSNKAFVQFLGYALRSATEVQSHLYVALDQGYVSREVFDDLYQRAVKAKSIIHGFTPWNNVRSVLFHGVNAISSQRST